MKGGCGGAASSCRRRPASPPSTFHRRSAAARRAPLMTVRPSSEKTVPSDMLSASNRLLSVYLDRLPWPTRGPNIDQSLRSIVPSGGGCCAKAWSCRRRSDEDGRLSRERSATSRPLLRNLRNTFAAPLGFGMSQLESPERHLSPCSRDCGGAGGPRLSAGRFVAAACGLGLESGDSSSSSTLSGCVRPITSSVSRSGDGAQR